MTTTRRCSSCSRMGPTWTPRHWGISLFLKIRKSQSQTRRRALIGRPNYRGYAYYGEFPLAFAACFGNKDIYDLLIQHGNFRLYERKFTMLTSYDIDCLIRNELPKTMTEKFTFNLLLYCIILYWILHRLNRSYSRSWSQSAGLIWKHRAAHVRCQLQQCM